MLFATVFALGCKKEKETLENVVIPRLLIESRGVDYGSLAGAVVSLPMSGTRITVQKTPVVNEFEIRNVELVQVELGLALLIQTTDQGARDLYRGTVTNMGGRIVLVVNGTAIGARRIDQAIQDGNFYTFVELSDEAIHELVIQLKESLPKIQKLKG